MARLFDFNHDGKMSTFEKIAEASFVMEMMHEKNKKTELEQSGLNPDELEFMAWDERREVLEDAGLDPEDYDF